MEPSHLALHFGDSHQIPPGGNFEVMVTVTEIPPGGIILLAEAFCFSA
jgi:hypothetical protein